MIYTDDYPVLYDIVHLYGEELDFGDYPIWDESKREWLEYRIYEHFEYRKIAQDTPAKFNKFLKRRMAEMMPTINPIFALLDQADLSKEYMTWDESDSTSANGGTQETLFSDTPQTQLSGEENYATNLNVTKNDGTANQTDKSIHGGRSSSLGAVATEWMASVNNALYIVFNGLEPLFLQVWDERPFE